MRRRLSYLWRRQRLALIAFVAVTGIAGFFGFHTVRQAIYWSDPMHQDQPLDGWMTPRYVARSYDIPPHVAGPALFLTPDAPPRRISLDAIAAEQNVSINDLQVRIDAAVTDWRAGGERTND
ncbi:hypothetical protein ACJ5NV_08995 [Loktanella agnita]|uniref:hypothetical protein n=1 Tax=Loktanella agnita TaxID=287097 RepID=UPI0039858CD8